MLVHIGFQEVLIFSFFFVIFEVVYCMHMKIIEIPMFLFVFLSLKVSPFYAFSHVEWIKFVFCLRVIVILCCC